MSGYKPSPTHLALQPRPILTVRPGHPTHSGRRQAGVPRSTLSPPNLSPLSTLCCALDDPGKVQELNIGSFILYWGREEGQGRSPCRKGLPDPRTPALLPPQSGTHAITRAEEPPGRGSPVTVRALHRNVPAPWRLQAPGPQWPQTLKLHGSQRDPASQEQGTQAGAVWDAEQDGYRREVPVPKGKAAQFRVSPLPTDNALSPHNTQLHHRKPEHTPFPLPEPSTPQLTSMTPGMHVRVVNS